MAEASRDTGLDPVMADLGSLHLRKERAWQSAQDTWARAQATWARAQATWANQTKAAKGVSSKKLLTVSALARLRAHNATMPVIEHAKGMLMAQQGFGPDEAFDLLRRASQLSNIPVRELASHIVRSAASPGNLAKDSGGRSARRGTDGHLFGADAENGRLYLGRR